MPGYLEFYREIKTAAATTQRERDTAGNPQHSTRSNASRSLLPWVIIPLNGRRACKDVSVASNTTTSALDFFGRSSKLLNLHLSRPSSLVVPMAHSVTLQFIRGYEGNQRDFEDTTDVPSSEIASAAKSHNLELRGWAHTSLRLAPHLLARFPSDGGTNSMPSMKNSSPNYELQKISPTRDHPTASNDEIDATKCPASLRNLSGLQNLKKVAGLKAESSNSSTDVTRSRLAEQPSARSQQKAGNPLGYTLTPYVHLEGPLLEIPAALQPQLRVGSRLKARGDITFIRYL